VFTLALLLWLTPAFADDGDAESLPSAVDASPEPQVLQTVPEPEPEPIVISLDVALPSALDRVDQAAEELAGDPGAAELLSVDPSGALLRGRFGLRPRLGWTGWVGQPGGAMRAGATLRHRWWSLLPVGPQWSGESALSGSLAFAGARGPEASAHSLVGAWVGPVSLMVGPRLAWQASSFTRGEPLPGGLSAGPLAVAATGLGPLSLQVGGGPGWLLAGERDPADLPLGEEWFGLAGLGAQLGVVQVGLRGQALGTDAGTLLDLTFALSLSLK
jgi:hypothetical protein